MHASQAALEEIQSGYIVKVGVTHSALNGERFWGLVKEKSGATTIIKVQQKMVSGEQHGICDGDILVVRERNIFGIIDNRGVRVWDPCEL